MTPGILQVWQKYGTDSIITSYVLDLFEELARNNFYYASWQTVNSEDEEEPEAAIEEQLIFRVPEGPMCEKLHEMAKKREISQDVKLNFKGKHKRNVLLTEFMLIFFFFFFL